MIVPRIRWKLASAVLQTIAIAVVSAWFAVAQDNVGLGVTAVFFGSLASLGISKRPWNPRPLLNLSRSGITTGWGAQIPWEEISSVSIGKFPLRWPILRKQALAIEVADASHYLSGLSVTERFLARVGKTVFPAAPLLVIQQSQTQVPLEELLDEMSRRAGRDLSQR